MDITIERGIPNKSWEKRDQVTIHVNDGFVILEGRSFGRGRLYLGNPILRQLGKALIAISEEK